MRLRWNRLRKTCKTIRKGKTKFARMPEAVLANARRIVGCLLDAGEACSEVHMQPCYYRTCAAPAPRSGPHAGQYQSPTAAAAAAAASGGRRDAAKHVRLARARSSK